MNVRWWHRNSRVVETPFVSLPQCASPNSAYSRRMSSRSDAEMSQSRRSLSSRKIHGLTSAPRAIATVSTPRASAAA